MSRAFEVTREIDLPAAPDDVWTAITAASRGLAVPDGDGDPRRRRAARGRRPSRPGTRRTAS